ncbi:MAG: hypothetical protein N3E52_05225 [Candidatus Bathyarchaeota archaeon]|nr:hypothetical protein [Candidatus Bathyarchaeota archaeon]
MSRLKLNKKGQFTIIASMLVAIVLIAAVMTTYSAIRYAQLEDQPRVLSAVDEINLALKHVLGFTVGYYGSVLQVTGNTTYAKQLALNYLKSGLVNIGDIRPEWGPSFDIRSFDLRTYWFTNVSYSAGNFTVSYDLNGLGVYDMTYSTSCSLYVEVLTSSGNQARIRVTKDGGEPVVNLGKQSLKFYRYIYSNLTWEHVIPSGEPTIYADGIYEIPVPSGIAPDSYVISIEDSRGIIVVASSFSRYTIDLEWYATQTNKYVDLISDVDEVPDKGVHSNFTAQQYGPDGIFDTLTEMASGKVTLIYNSTIWRPISSTTCFSGNLTSLETDNGVYMQLLSYPTAYSPTEYSTIEYDSANSTSSSSSVTSLSWWHTTGFGSNRLLIVAVDVFNKDGTPTTVTSITYDGVALSQVATALWSLNPQVRSYVFILTNPAPGTKLINVNFASSTFAVGGSVTYTNVNQTNPVLTYNVTSASGISASVSVTSSGTNSKMLYGHLATYRTSSYTINESGQTSRWSQTSQQYKGRASDKSVTNGSSALSWTISQSASWVAIAVLLQPTRLPTEYTCAAEFVGSSDTFSWDSITWTIDGSANLTDISVTFQLYNYTAGQYPTSGEGYMSATFGTTDITKTQNITVKPADFRNSTGHWQIKVIAVKATSTQFNLKLDLLRFSPVVPNYALELEEQWISPNIIGRYELCIKTGSLGTENLKVEVRSGSAWVSVISALQPNKWNNISVTQYISSSFTIRFKGTDDVTDPILDNWEIDAVLLTIKTPPSFLLTLPESTIVVELLQNGTMRWLGQALRNITQTLPIPPIPVKALRVNQTINGVDVEVPFQVEDWASEYRIPQGLTNNATVFSNRQMLVFLVNATVSKITIWWNGSDEALQTSKAYTNLYFTNDDPNNNRLSNGKIQLQIGSFSVTSTVIGTSTSSSANFMRINGEDSVYGAGAAYVIHHGVVRDIIQQEAEWNSGADNCPNLYANIVITLPASVTYYTYDLRLMFISSSQSRNITELRPISITVSPSSPTAMTENGTLNGFPIVTNGTGTFYNFTVGGWTPHHWSQLISGSRGAGIMFTDIANRQLYVFNAIAGSNVGAIKIDSSSRTIALLPVASGSVSFTYALDITWHGAVVTFDGTTPIYRSSDESGLWILVEYPPTVTVTTAS